MTGGSSRDVARTARAKAGRGPRHGAASARGMAAARGTAAVLAELPETWTVLSGVCWPGREHARIDHIAIGPTGVFVIDAQGWDGSVSVTGEVLREDGYSHGPALVAAREATRSIAALVPSLPAQAFQPVLCLVRAEELRRQVAGVRVCTTATMLATLTDRPAVLSAEWLEFLRFDLDMSTHRAGEPADPDPSPRAELVAPRRRRDRRRRSERMLSVACLLLAGTMLAGIEYYAHLAEGTPAGTQPTAVVQQAPASH